MPKRPAIKWTDKQTKELQRQVKRFNAKLTRTAKRSPELVDFLPEKLSVRELKSTIKTAADLRLVSARVDRAFKEGAFKPITTEAGVRTTAFELRELSLGVQRINRQRARELKAANPSTYKGTMGTVRENNLKPKKFNPQKITPSNWDKFVESVERQAMASYEGDKIAQYKRNYIRALETVFGSTADELIKKIEAAPASLVYQMYYDNPLLQIGFIYDPLESAAIFEALTEQWNNVLEQ